jgi:hypothetical protein
MPKLYGACVEYLRQTYGGDFSILEHTQTIGTAQVHLLGGDSERVSLTLVNLGATNIYIAPTVEVGVLRGLRLAANGGTVSMSLLIDSLLPAASWYAIGDGAGGTLYYIAVRRASIVEPEGE